MQNASSDSLREFACASQTLPAPVSIVAPTRTLSHKTRTRMGGILTTAPAESNRREFRWEPLRSSSKRVAEASAEASAEALTFSYFPRSELGFKIWPGAFCLADWFEREIIRGELLGYDPKTEARSASAAHKKGLDNAPDADEQPAPAKRYHVLEMGSGVCGVTSLAAAKWYPGLFESICVSDRDVLMPYLGANIGRNTSSQDASGGADADVDIYPLAINWFDTLATRALLRGKKPFDFVLLSDVLYFPHLFCPLLDTLALVCGKSVHGGGGKNSSTVVYIANSHAFPKLKPDIAQFLRLARGRKYGFEVEKIADFSHRELCRDVIGVELDEQKRRTVGLRSDGEKAPAVAAAETRQGRVTAPDPARPLVMDCHPESCVGIYRLQLPAADSRSTRGTGKGSTSAQCSGNFCFHPGHDGGGESSD